MEWGWTDDPASWVPREVPGVFEEVDGVLRIYGRTGRLTARNGGPRPRQCRAIRSGLPTLSALAPMLMKLVDAGALLRRPSQHPAECEALPEELGEAAALQTMVLPATHVRTAALVARREAMHPAALDNVGIELAGTIRPLSPSLPLPLSWDG
jgi:hypothetical protein